MTGRFLPVRPRRLRRNAAVRQWVRETRLHPRQLVLPAFVVEGLDRPRPIPSMPGVHQHSVDSVVSLAGQVRNAGLGGIMLFGVPQAKTADGSRAWAADGILNNALSRVRNHVGDDIVIMADTCLDEFTSHGHCGVLDGSGRVDNDRTLELYAKMAVSQALAGAHVVAPSGMMDGQVAAIREALEGEGLTDTLILAYAAKYASAFYGPFRDAVQSTLHGHRRTYQQDPANSREALREIELDIAEGADLLMVKPAMAYLDIVRMAAEHSPVPVAAYQVSGEYSMICAAGEKGWIDRGDAMIESLDSIRRAGADTILTYFALEAAEHLGYR